MLAGPIFFMGNYRISERRLVALFIIFRQFHNPSSLIPNNNNNNNNPPHCFRQVVLRVIVGSSARSTPHTPWWVTKTALPTPSISR